MRESVFLSTIRSFFKAFAAVIGIAAALIVVIIVLSSTIKTPLVSEKTTFLVDIDAHGSREVLSPSTPVILKVNIHGVIGSYELDAGHIKAQLADSRTGELKGNRVKAILLHINSPGGAAIDSFNIYKDLMDYKKKYQIPIYAFVDGLCASGAMMIACSADKINSNPVGIIGSVGVRMGPNFNFAQLMEKLGIQQKTLTRGTDKDMLNPFRPWKPGEDEPLELLLSYDYNMFIDIVTHARPRLSREKLINTYGARVFDPVKAQSLGYIDNGNSSYSDTINELVEKAGLSKDEPYQVVELRIQQTILSEFVEGKSPLISGILKHKVEIPSDAFIQKPLYLYAPILDDVDE